MGARKKTTVPEPWKDFLNPATIAWAGLWAVLIELAKRYGRRLMHADAFNVLGLFLVPAFSFFLLADHARDLKSEKVWRQMENSPESGYAWRGLEGNILQRNLCKPCRTWTSENYCPKCGRKFRKIRMS